MSAADTPWTCTAVPPEDTLNLPPLPASCDVCIIGAGIAGLTAAYLLARSGRSVVVLEAGFLGRGETGRTSAHLTHALDDRFTALERLHGHTGARLAAESHTAAIDFIEQLVEERHIACDFKRVNGYLINAQGNAEALMPESAAALRAGLPVTFLTDVPGLGTWAGPAIQFPRQARFDPGAYLLGLARCASDAGAKIFSHSRVTQVSEGDSVTIEVAGDTTINAAITVVATNVPINDRLVLQTKLEAYRSYVITLRLPSGAFPDILLWDDAEPYHYVRCAHDQDGDLLIVGGEDHKTGQGPEDGTAPYAALEAWARARIPGLGARVHAWSGQIIEPVDALAYIGLNPGSEKVYVHTGDSGNGLTHGTLGGMLISDLVRGLPNAWAELYRPNRLTLRAVGEYAGHNANVLKQYADWLAIGSGVHEDEIAPGAGAIVRIGVHPQAVYRSSTGDLQRCSAICPHLGGLVRWNETEKTWDCPCHGSRFSPTGEVINGPANSGLAAIKESGSSFPAEAVVV